MATPNPSSSSSTKQITLAAFKKYVTTMEENTSSSSLPDTRGVDNGDLSPLGSPSAITPTPLEHEFEDLWVERTTTSRGNKESTKTRITIEQVKAFEGLALESFGHGIHGDSNAVNEHVTQIVVKRLQVIGDEFDQRFNSRTWRVITMAFHSQDGSILQQFSNTIISLKKELSLQMVVKVFYFGYRLLSTPLDFYTEQQSRIMKIFADFLVSELSDWIEQQGGWESILNDDHLHTSYSTSDLPDHEPSTISSNMSRFSSIESSSNSSSDQGSITPPAARSKSHSYSEASTRPSSSSVPIPRRKPRPVTLRLGSPQSYPSQSTQEFNSGSPSTTPTISHSSLGSVVSFSIGVSFGIALCSFFFK